MGGITDRNGRPFLRFFKAQDRTTRGDLHVSEDASAIADIGGDDIDATDFTEAKRPGLLPGVLFPGRRARLIRPAIRSPRRGPSPDR